MKYHLKNKYLIQNSSSSKHFIPLKRHTVENFTPLNYSPNIFIPINFSLKIFVPLKICSNRVPGVKKDRPLR